MARSRTLGSLRADARERADMVNSLFITDANFNEFINQSAARLYNKLVKARGQAYYQSSYVITTTTATTYTLPSDFYQLQLVQINFGGRKQTMRPFMLKDSSRWSEASPQAGYQVTIRYTPAPVRMTNDSDTFDGIAGWEEWIVLDAAIKALNKEESDVQVLMAQRADVEAEISGLAPSRDAQWPDRVVDMERIRDRWSPPLVPQYRLAQNSIEILWGPNAIGEFW